MLHEGPALRALFFTLRAASTAGAYRRSWKARSAAFEPGSARLSKTIGRDDQLMQVAGLECRMSGIGYDMQIRFRPRAMQVPGAAQRTYDVIAPLHDHGGNAAQSRRIAQQLIVAFEESAIDEVVAFDARERECEFILGARRD